MSLPAPELEAALDDLVASRVLLARGTPPHATYSFRHALIQDAAYGTLLRSKREELHGRIAEALTGSLAVEECAEPELIGHHYTEAGDAERAIPFWRVAGRQAFQRSACTEAVAHLERALALARGLPDSPARARLELDLLMALNPALITLKGMAAEEVGALQAQALVLADAIGDREQAFRALFGSWIYTIQQPPIANAERITSGSPPWRRRQAIPATGCKPSTRGGRRPSCWATWPRRIVTA